MSTETKAKKPGRKKEVWPSSEIYHVWAHQRADYGRCSGANVFFQGQVIYSYGRHFPMAKLLLDKAGKPNAVILTTRTYSNTTSKHQSDTRSAVNHLRTFRATDVTETNANILKDYKKRLDATCEDCGKSKRSKHEWLARAEGLKADGNGFAEFVGLKGRIDFPKGFDLEAETAAAKVHKAKADAARAKREETQRVRDEQRRKEAREKYQKDIAEYGPKLEAWLAGVGSTGSFPRPPYNPDGPWERNELHRLRVHGSRIETSGGAIFQIESATPVLALCRLDRAGQVVREDMNVDGYRGVRIDYDRKVVSVGCHHVAFEEAERIAKQLGL